MHAKAKKSLGRDVFDRSSEKKGGSGTLKKILAGRGAAAAKEIDVKVKLTPANLKHLDAIRARLDAEGKGHYTRSDLIRVAIALLSAEDF